MSACIHGLTRCSACLGLSEALQTEKIHDRYAKALVVVEAARGLDKWQHTCEGDLPDEDEAEAAFEALYSNWANLRTALAAFDEVADK